MHGIVFAELKKFVDASFGTEAWPALLTKAGMSGRVYMPVQEYPDAEIQALVVAAVEATKMPANAILEAFGEFITPGLLKMYGHLVKPEWRTLDFIEKAESSIHTVVRVKNPGAKPPQLRVVRSGPNSVVVYYDSARRMCALAKGIAKGVAKHYKEQISFREGKCMHKGDAKCEIEMTVTAAQGASA